jgi:NADH:ubiquinone oxidoreductase subunit 6 (subunit J)
MLVAAVALLQIQMALFGALVVLAGVMGLLQHKVAQKMELLIQVGAVVVRPELMV